MTLIQRIAGVLHFGRRATDPREDIQLTVYQQLDRLADSRSMVEHDLAREEQLAERLEAEGRKAIAAGNATKAQTLSDRRATILVRISELRAAHRALTEAITQRSAAVAAVPSQDSLEKVDQHETRETYIDVNS